MSALSLPFWWRVTRYDPSKRDARGAYAVDSWTSIADVGGRFDGALLTIEEYERVEQAYLEAFAAFADDSGVSQVIVRGLEVGDRVCEGEAFPIVDAKRIVARLLREEVICRLEAPGGDFATHVGFDLYMYVGSAASCESAVERAEAIGLFVEPVPESPQRAEGE